MKLLLIWVHGFKGGADTFAEFPARVEHLVSSSLSAEWSVESVVYPPYDTRGELSVAVDNYVTWVTGTEGGGGRERNETQGNKAQGHRGGDETFRVLLGHSMGGLVIADAAPRVEGLVGLVAFDTPYYGVNPGVFRTTIDRVLSVAGLGYAGVIAAMGGWASRSRAQRGTEPEGEEPQGVKPEGTGREHRRRSGCEGSQERGGGETREGTGHQSAGDAFADTTPQLPLETAPETFQEETRTAQTRFQSTWMGIGSIAAAATALGAAGYLYAKRNGKPDAPGEARDRNGFSEASSNRNGFSEPLATSESEETRSSPQPPPTPEAQGTPSNWITSHLSFIKELWKTETLTKRLAETVNQTRLHCFYTQTLDRSTFIVVPSNYASHFTPNVNDRADNPISAHIEMFTDKSSGMYELARGTSGTIVKWLDELE